MIKDQLPFGHDNYCEVNHNFYLLGGWNTAASIHVIGLLPILIYYTNVFNELVITTSEPDPVNFTVSSLDETLYTGTVTGGIPTNTVMKKLKKCKKVGIEKKVKKQDGMSMIIVNYSDNIIR